ncbi:MAG: helix-turn-helix transcriptional regulator [Bacteroidota bacterium]
MNEIKQSITKREHQIVSALSQGMNSYEISEKLFISIYTVQTHRKNVMEKTSARNTAHLIRRCFELGLFNK